MNYGHYHGMIDKIEKGHDPENDVGPVNWAQADLAHLARLLLYQSKEADGQMIEAQNTIKELTEQLEIAKDAIKQLQIANDNQQYPLNLHALTR